MIPWHLAFAKWNRMFAFSTMLRSDVFFTDAIVKLNSSISNCNKLLILADYLTNGMIFGVASWNRMFASSTMLKSL
jgi:hypothetical protein